MTDEDAYPVGGFASISNRGSIESLLHSQLAYMEPGEAARPDLFDVHFLRDELLYYSRDENQFLRQRRGFVFVLSKDLADARFKDAGLPYQRIVLVQALVVAAVHKLVDWLDTEAVHFHVAMPVANRTAPLAPERELFDVIFREQREAGVVKFIDYDVAEPAEHLWRQLPQRYVTKRLWIGATLDRFAESADQIVVGAVPTLRLGDVTLVNDTVGEDAWRETMKELLADWV